MGPRLLLLATLLSGSAHAASAIKLSARTRLDVDHGRGTLILQPAQVEFLGRHELDHAETYLWKEGLDLGVLSVATLVCHGDRFLGYKGFSVRLAGEEGRLELGELLALGTPARLIARTHPWLVAASAAGIEGLCGAEFQEKLASSNFRSLPTEFGRERFTAEYAAGGRFSRETLTLRWDARGTAATTTTRP
ncbi:MAG: hypothetical protein HY553_16010 [Elusimicrobia bacterium]|nr:hypothetical protein [Elusimicrobiota bacterium]